MGGGVRGFVRGALSESPSMTPPTTITASPPAMVTTPASG
jgi:hypothetical protein